MRIVSFEEFLKLDGEVVYAMTDEHGVPGDNLAVKVQNLNNDFCYDNLDAACLEGAGSTYEISMNLAIAGVDQRMDFSESTTRMGDLHPRPRFAVFSKADVIALRDRLNVVIENSVEPEPKGE